MDTMTQDMRDVKVDGLSGKALAWAVAKAAGMIDAHESLDDVIDSRPIWWIDYDPQDDWAQGGPLIQTQRISLSGPGTMGGHWSAYIDTGSFAGSRYWFGDTALIAACRALVGTALGEFVSVPAVMLGVE